MTVIIADILYCMLMNNDLIINANDYGIVSLLFSHREREGEINNIKWIKLTDMKIENSRLTQNLRWPIRIH